MAEPRRRHLYLLINTPRSRSSTKKNRLTNPSPSHSLQVMAGKITNLLFSLFSRTKCVIIFKIFILSIYLFLQSGKGIFSPPTVKQISPVNNFFHRYHCSSAKEDVRSGFQQRKPHFCFTFISHQITAFFTIHLSFFPLMFCQRDFFFSEKGISIKYYILSFSHPSLGMFFYR